MSIRLFCLDKNLIFLAREIIQLGLPQNLGIAINSINSFLLQVDSNASTKIGTELNYDPDLGDNNFSDESDVEVSAITSKPSCSR